MRTGTQSIKRVLKPLLAKRDAPIGTGDWLAGVAIGSSGARRFRLFRPPDVKFGERLPLMVMLHGCHQDAKSFAASTRMNVVAARERFLVLYPEQDRLSNPQGCWNWFDTKSGLHRSRFNIRCIECSGRFFSTRRFERLVLRLSPSTTIWS